VDGTLILTPSLLERAGERLRAGGEAAAIVPANGWATIP